MCVCDGMVSVHRIRAGVGFMRCLQGLPLIFMQYRPRLVVCLGCWWKIL